MGGVRRRLAMAGLLACAIVAVVGVVWLAVTGLMAYRQAQELRASVDTARAAATAYDMDGVAEQLPVIIEGTGRLESLTSGPAWWVAARIPWAGRTVEAVRTLATVSHAVAASGEPLVPLAQSAADGRLRTPAGGIDIGLVSSAAPALRSMRVAATTAQSDLEALDMTGVPESVAGQIDALAAELPGLINGLDRAASAAEIIPGFLGADGPRTWAVLLQNTSEARGSGGIVGAYAIMKVDNGQPILVEAADRKSGLDDYPIPYGTVVGPEAASAWGGDLVEWSTYNILPDFRVTGALTAAGMTARKTPVDGVVALDSRVVAAILAGTGPVTAAGVTVDAASAADYFTKGIYADFPDVDAKDAATVDLLRATLEAFLTRDVDLAAVASRLRPLIPQRRLLVWTNVPREGAWLETTSLGGTVDLDLGSTIAVAFNNGSGNKLDAYVESTIDFTSAQCRRDPSLPSTLRVDLRNVAPDGLPDYVTPRVDVTNPPPNSTMLVVSVFAPADATLFTSLLDNEPLGVESFVVDGRPIWQFRVELRQGRAASLELSWVSSPGRGPARVVTQPMAIDTAVETATVGCSATS